MIQRTSTKTFRKQSRTKNVLCATPMKNMTYGSFRKDLNDNKISRIDITPGSSHITYTEKDGEQYMSNVLLSDALIETAVSKDADILVFDQPSSLNINSILGFLFPVIFLIVLLMRSAGQPANQQSKMFGGTNYDLQMAEDIDTTFDDVAGIDDAKEEIVEIVDFLKNPKIYTDAGAKIPKGCLLVGQPGTGKTLLAKAIAGEADVPFISCSASQFVELFVGLGSSRIRSLFEMARKNAPCIIFIDEIDAIGKQRGGSMVSGGGNDEREQTLNQLLTEMDGFGNNEGVVILGATNRIDVLDPALLRPGRFDRKVTVGLPDVNGREKILKVYQKDKKFDPSTDVRNLARRTMGLSGADLMNIMNEAAIMAARNKRDVINNEDIESAYEKITIGLPKKQNASSERKKLVSYHEAGHALVGYLIGDYDDIAKVSIVPRGNAGGITYFIPKDDDEQGMYTKTYLENRLCVALGGHAAEEIVFGKENVTTGAVGDFKQATDLARQMVGQYGMSDTIGKVYLENASQNSIDMIDSEARSLNNSAYAKAIDILTEHRLYLGKLADALVERETIQGDEIYDILYESCTLKK